MNSTFAVNICLLCKLDKVTTSQGDTAHSFTQSDGDVLHRRQHKIPCDIQVVVGDARNACVRHSAQVFFISKVEQVHVHMCVCACVYVEVHVWLLR